MKQTPFLPYLHKYICFSNAPRRDPVNKEEHKNTILETKALKMKNEKVPNSTFYD